MTPLLPTADHYLFNLIAMTSSDAKRIRKQAIKEAFNYTCVYCGHHHQDLTIDHVRPRSRGGSDETKNLLPSCKQCNTMKGSRDWLQFMRDTFGPTPRENLILQWIN